MKMQINMEKTDNLAKPYLKQVSQESCSWFCFSCCFPMLSSVWS